MSMLSVEAALGQILNGISPSQSEVVPVNEAIDRALATPVTAGRTLPPWDNSAMDGFAVRSSDCTAPGARLTVVETIFAGALPAVPIGTGQCARIMTGAATPPGADAVVMQERTKRTGDLVTIETTVAPGANIRRAGEEVFAGDVLLPAGTRLGIAEAAAMWGQNLSTVSVWRQPRVAICSNGDELVPVGQVIGPGQIVDTNSPALALAVRRNLGLPTTFAPAKDTLDAVTATVRRGLEFDVLLCVAGASVGDKDFTRDALTAAGVDMNFWRVAMKPGKPLAFGRKGRTLVFGLPGNPVSALVTFELFVGPALRALQGLPTDVPLQRVRLATTIDKPAGLHHFVRATVVDGVATPLVSQSSGSLASAMSATHLLSLPVEVTRVEAGDEATAIPVSWCAR